MTKAPTRNSLRIIGGTWRSRRLEFPTVAQLRPTPDRVRETLFNWLQHRIGGARCLDLFAGSGALGFEALSRGANEVVFVEIDPAAVQALRANAQRLQADNAQIIHEEALHYLAKPADPFDIIFLDPPFKLDLIENSLSALQQGGALATGALLYFESAATRPPPTLMAGWEILKEKRAGDVRYQLVGQHTL